MLSNPPTLRPLVLAARRRLALGPGAVLPPSSLHPPLSRSFARAAANFSERRAASARGKRAPFGQYRLITPDFTQLTTTATAQRTKAARAAAAQVAPERRPPWGLDPSWTGNPNFGDDEPPRLVENADRDALRAAGQLAKRMLRLAGSLVYEGATTATIDAAVHDAVVNAGAYPSPLLYQGSFPKSICTSINNVMAHGIPDERPLIAGDILNIDVTVYLNGFHGDCSAMFTVGQIDQAAMDLIAATRSALDAAIAACEPGAPFSVIAHAIGRVASEARFAVSPDMCGHGIGRDFHCAPIVHHVPTHAARDLTMEPGMAFTIEPILCHGSPAFVMWPDAWTVVTKDGGRSAQFEETLLVTEDGIEVVTKLDN